ncbi:MerR family transcriptional regulator [Paenibacillus sp. Marseille-P2973]|uniref:MerR family transcriptional regulator n=1 Tax=Paenibacillus sp. Marseille-P2973 TaxID=1871032 RepID=UPI001B37EA49|nr:MerR family transcriptional regulator [Paenibacillus sp. Marseille-P2973]MBQ4900702.1 MerR family transcriptional regulator [Paenibacillus sp. Marseille-P2973]
MLFTVKEVASIANVTVKTLHHYHKVGLLIPAQVNESGYRLYGNEELERLQEIMFYRELDFPLDQIKQLLAENPERLAILSQQKELLSRQKQRLEHILSTLEKSIVYTERGEIMDQGEMFKGFNSEEEWADALQEQNRYLQETYKVDLIGEEPLDVPALNEQAAEAAGFMEEMADSLRNGLKYDDESVQNNIHRHLQFLKKHGHPATVAEFALQTSFFLEDDFHRSMLEGQQTGLAYYLNAAAEALAKSGE